MTGQNCGDFLSKNKRLSQLSEVSEWFLTLNRFYQAGLPLAFRNRSRVVILTQAGLLTIFADNGMIASRIKWMSDDIKKKLQAQGYLVTDVSVKVRPVVVVEKAPKSIRLGEKAIAALEAASENVKDPALSEALKRMANRHRTS